MESILENLNDVAGVRVICSFVDDIYAVADMLTDYEKFFTAAIAETVNILIKMIIGIKIIFIVTDNEFFAFVAVNTF